MPSPEQSPAPDGSAPADPPAAVEAPTNGGASGAAPAAASPPPASPPEGEGSRSAEETAPVVEAVAPPAEGKEPAGEGQPAQAADGAPKKRKRRRRRKKKGAQAGAPGEGAPAGEHAEGEEHEADDEGEAQAEGAAPKEGEAEAKGQPPKDRGPKDRGKNRDAKGKGPGKPDGDKKGDGKGRHKGPKHHDKRERPVFGLGDVVFGKILEITDDAIFVDLSGKAKAIFDRAEMLLPDEPPEAEAPEPAESHEDAVALAEAKGDDTGAEAEAPAEDAAPDTSQDKADAADTTRHDVVPEAAPPPPAGEGPPAAETSADAQAPRFSEAPDTNPDHPTAPEEVHVDSAVPPTITSGGVERKGGRRIIVAAGARVASEPSSVEGESGAAVAAPDPLTTEMHEGETTSEAPPQKEASSPPKPAPYAPPIVLEVGAHFVALVHNDGARGGLIVLTRHPKRVSQSKGLVSSALREHKLVKGLVTGTVKGGAEVDVDGLRAFVPGSHMDLRLGSDLTHFIGQRLDFYVTQYGKRGRDVVLSRKELLEADAKANREAALGKLHVGSVVEGVVRSVVTFGAFIDLGGVEGLVALPEMSHNRADTPSDVFKVGEKTEVKILRVDDRGKVWLSRKQATVDPRLEAIKKYAVSSKHTGKVVRLQPFGAFVELEPGIDGLIHLMDLSLKRIEHPSEVVKVGDPIDVVVSSVDATHQKIALHPAPAGAAADETPQRVQLHKPLKVVVVAVEQGGLLVRVVGATGRHARGFITAAATGTPRGTELRKPFPVGTQLEAKVIEMDPKRGELKLSIKALREDTERSAYQQYRQQVTREAKFGTFGDLLAKKGITPK